ncbi:MAG: hypothetical protein QGG88_10150 [Gammaproteobacteria bacterium]|jgi:hypothetical protein|nr:hypothetical protein [Gammaproteobacteria bacterium]
MIPNFLCQTHRKHYQQHPSEALLAWDNWMSAGHQSVLNQDNERAFRYYGSSMEVAAILMEQSTQIALTAITPFERYQLAGQHLAELCHRNSHEEMANAIVEKLNQVLVNQRYHPVTRATGAVKKDSYEQPTPTVSMRVH